MVQSALSMNAVALVHNTICYGNKDLITELYIIGTGEK